MAGQGWVWQPQRAGENTRDRTWLGMAQEELQLISGVGGRVGWGHGLYPVGHPGSQAAHKRGVLGSFHWRLMTLPYWG